MAILFWSVNSNCLLVWVYSAFARHEHTFLDITFHRFPVYNPDRSPQDIIVASEGLCYLSRICPYNTPVNSPQAAALRYLLCNVVYGSHVENERDWDAVSSLTLSAICDRFIQVGYRLDFTYPTYTI